MTNIHAFNDTHKNIQILTSTQTSTQTNTQTNTDSNTHIQIKKYIKINTKTDKYK